MDVLDGTTTEAGAADPSEWRIDAGWLSEAEESALLKWKRDLLTFMPMCTVAWTGLHVASMILSPVLSDPHSTMSKKDQTVWHNKVVSVLHAAVAVGQGLWWLLASGERAALGNRTFAFLPDNAFIAAVGASYFVYDSFFMLFSASLRNFGYVAAILGHHAIFLGAYASTLAFPCAISITTFHYYQLTELSTVFLHLTWMLSKAQANYESLFLSTIALLATFLIRVISNMLIAFNAVSWTWNRHLWEAQLPRDLERGKLWFAILFSVGNAAMVLMNMQWFKMLINKAKDLQERVARGKPPTEDYERDSKKE